MYEVKIISIGLDTSFYPPVFNVTTRVTHDIDRHEPMRLRYTLLLPVTEGAFNFVERIDLTKGKSTHAAKLALDYHSFHCISEQLKQSNGITVNSSVDLLSVGGHRLAHGEYSMQIELDNWVKARDETGKFAPLDTVAIDHQSTTLVTETATQLRNEMSQVEKKLIDDPALQLQKKAFESLVETVKQHLLDRPEIKELKGFEPLIAVCSIVKVNHRWAIAAALLSSFEGYVKKWLIDHAGETYESMKNKNFDELTGKLRGQLKKDQIKPDETKIAQLSTIRSYRNLVLHEMHEPSEIELETISKQTVDLMKYIESLKPLK